MFGLKDSILPEREPGLANGGTYWYLTDALGSVSDLVDHRGDVARQYRYDAFGGLFTGTVGVYNTHGLTGKTYDAKSGLMDYAARWYDPTAGRFTQKDPFMGFLNDPQTQHRFAYTANNPVNWVDPTGHMYYDPEDYTILYSAWQRVDSTPTQHTRVGDPDDYTVYSDTWSSWSLWTRKATVYTKDWIFVDRYDETWESTYAATHTNSWHWDGYWVYKFETSGELRPPGVEDEDPGPSREELERQQRERDGAAIQASAGSAPADSRESGGAEVSDSDGVCQSQTGVAESVCAGLTVVGINTVKPVVSYVLTEAGIGTTTEIFTVAATNMGPGFRMIGAKNVTTNASNLVVAGIAGLVGGPSGAVSEIVSDSIGIASKGVGGRVLTTLGGNIVGGLIADALFPETANEVCPRDGLPYCAWWYEEQERIRQADLERIFIDER